MRHPNFARFAALAALPLVQTGCGGAAGVGGAADVSIAPPTAGCVDAAGCKYGATSTHLAGVGVLTARNQSLEATERTVSYVSVDLDVPGNRIAYRDAKVSTLGEVVVGDISDPSTTLIAQDVAGPTVGTTMVGAQLVGPGTGYDFVTPVLSNNVELTTPYELEGYIGLVTDVSAVPAAGVATYSGSASGGLDTGGLLPEGLLGSAELAVDFGAGTVDLTADFSMATNGADLVTVTGMTIDGNTFSGGELAVMEYDAIPAEDNATVSNVLGDNVTHQSNGIFFGIDESLALEGGGTTIGPDDVAGAVVATGSDGELFFVYRAE